MTTQLYELEKYFRKNSRLTAHQAQVSLGIARLSARIMDLESRGWQFIHQTIEVPTRYTKARVCLYVVLKRPKKG